MASPASSPTWPSSLPRRARPTAPARCFRWTADCGGTSTEESTMTRFGRWLVAAAALATFAAAGADPWPTRPVKVVVAFTAGGTTDLIARTVGARLGDRF